MKEHVTDPLDMRCYWCGGALAFDGTRWYHSEGASGDGHYAVGPDLTLTVVALTRRLTELEQRLADIEARIAEIEDATPTSTRLTEPPSWKEYQS